MERVFVHIERPTPRSQFIVQHMLRRLLGWDVVIVSAREELRTASGPTLIYGSEAGEGALHITPDRMVLEQGIARCEPAVEVVDGAIKLFPNGARSDLFDPFAAAFWILSRSEEWQELPRDEHGRPLTNALHATRHGYLHRAVVDEWALWLAAQWRSLDPRVPAVHRSYSHMATLDVDNGFKFLGRPLWRTVGSATRDLLHGRWAEVHDRAQVLRGMADDPYDIYGDFRSITARQAGTVMASFLMNRGGRYDHAVTSDDPLMRRRMMEIAAWAHVAVHPSYRSTDRPEMIGKERTMLEKVIGKPVTSSRQHFLRLRLPETYRELERIGIKEDHSMGFADAVGFRAGTCTPFPFYDLEQDRETDLMIFPFEVMDSALCYKMKLDPDQAIAAAGQVIDRVKAVQGTFIGVWHERFLSDHGAEKGWRRVVEEIIRYAAP